MKKSEIFVGPVLYYCWFEIGNKRYVIDIGQNILFWIYYFIYYNIRSDTGIKTVQDYKN